MLQPNPSLVEYAKRGSRVNAVSPGIIKTPMHPPEDYAQLASIHPVARMGEISDIVGAILYFESATFVTGEILHVDGVRARAIEFANGSGCGATSTRL